MGAVPATVLLNQTIQILDGQIFLEKGRVYRLVESAAPGERNLLLGEFTRLYNMMTRRHMLEVMRTYPSYQVLYEVTFEGVRTADGEFVPAPKSMGRRADGALKGDYLRLVEVKVLSEIERAISQQLRGKYNKFLSSSNLGAQLLNERSLKRWARSHGVALVFSALNPLTQATEEFEMPVRDVRISLVQTYNNMGDGIERASLYRPVPPSPPPSTKGGTRRAGGAGAAASRDQVARELSNAERTVIESPKSEMGRRGNQNRGIEDRGTKALEVRAPDAVTETNPGMRERSPGKISLKTTPEVSQTGQGFDPQEFMGGIANTTAAVEGAALMIYDAQLQSLYRAAWREAEDAYQDQALQNEIFRRRQDGEWVLVRFTFLVSEAPDPQGNFLVQFWSVSINHQSPRPGDTEPDQALMLERLHNSPAPQEYHAVTDNAGAASSRKLVPDGWSLRSTDYMMLRGFSQGPAKKRRRPNDHLYDNDWSRGTGGRCTE